MMIGMAIGYVINVNSLLMMNDGTMKSANLPTYDSALQWYLNIDAKFPIKHGVIENQETGERERA